MELGRYYTVHDPATGAWLGSLLIDIDPNGVGVFMGSVGGNLIDGTVRRSPLGSYELWIGGALRAYVTPQGVIHAEQGGTTPWGPGPYQAA